MDDIVTRLSRLDACAISDALDKLGLPGSVSGIDRCTTERRIWGRVVTVKLEKDDGRAAAPRHLGTTAIETAQPGDVIVLEQRTGVDAACWGGNLSLGAQLRGVAGVVIEGPGRDMDEARQYDFPVFASATVPSAGRSVSGKATMASRGPARASRTTIWPAPTTCPGSASVSTTVPSASATNSV